MKIEHKQGYTLLEMYFMVDRATQWKKPPNPRIYEDFDENNFVQFVPWSNPFNIEKFIDKFINAILDEKTWYLDQEPLVMAYLFSFRKAFALYCLQTHPDPSGTLIIKLEDIGPYVKFLMTDAWASNYFDHCMTRLGNDHFSLLDQKHRMRTDYYFFQYWRSSEEHGDSSP